MQELDRKYENFILQRSLASSAAENTSGEGSGEKELCSGSTPCGWAVYNQYTHYIDYFMKNK